MEKRTRECLICNYNLATIASSCHSQESALCKSCSKKHFKLAADHHTFSISTAENSESSTYYDLGESCTTPQNIIKSLERYSRKVSKFIEKLHKKSEEILQYLNQVIESSCDILQQVKQDITIKLEMLKSVSNSSQVSKYVTSYSEHKLAGVLKFYPKYLDITTKDLYTAINKMIYISDEEDSPDLQRKPTIIQSSLNPNSDEISRIEATDLSKMDLTADLSLLHLKLQEYQEEINYLKSQLASSSSPSEEISKISKLFHYSIHHDNRYIYIPKEDSLIQYDSWLNSSKSWNLKSYKTKSFLATSTCVLPNGDIFIVGGGHLLGQYSDEVFVFKIQDDECVKLPNLSEPRGLIACTYLNGIYTFGGFHESKLKIAEKFDIAERKWVRLSDMIQPRHSSSCVVIYDKIYIFLGGTTSSCEEYDITSNTYKLIHLEAPDSGSVAFTHEDYIYLVCKDSYTKYDRKFGVVKSKQHKEIDLWHMINNAIKYQDGVVFYDNWNQKVYSFNIASKKITLKLAFSREK
jgi:hypothetical protein